jgi:uncharacterized membrane protein YqjE
MSLSEDLRTIPTLLGDAVEQLGKLVQNEAQLARAELSEKISTALRGVLLMAAAAILIGPVLVMLLAALALALHAAGLSPFLAAVVSALVGAGIAAVLLLIGRSHLRPAKLTPTVTLHELEADIGAVKELVR